jgi:hypothetical protein
MAASDIRKTELSRLTGMPVAWNSQEPGKL